MNVALQTPWTAERFLDWAARQEGRHEFDGVQPVAMTGANVAHNRIAQNLYAALRARLRGTPCSCLGPDMAVRTTGEKIRCPDALVTCTKSRLTDRIAQDVRIVFEILSPDSGRRDRIEKMREYAGVRSILRYVILEARSSGLLVLHRPTGDAPWTAQPLMADDILPLPEIGIEVPVAELYEDIEFPES